MFNRCLSELTLSSSAAEKMFPSITAEPFCGDMTFAATMRALLPQRMAEGDEFHADVMIRTDSENDVKKTDAETFFGYLFGMGMAPNTFFIRGFCGTENGATASFKKVDEMFAARENFEEQKDIEAWLDKHQRRTRLFIDKKNHITVAFVVGLNLSSWHLLQSFTSRLLPWYFETNKLTDEEKKLLVSLTMRTSNEYETLIEELASKYDFRSARIRDLLSGVNKRANEKTLRSVREELRSVRKRADDYRDAYFDKLREVQDLVIKENGLLDMIENDTGESDLVDFIICNKNVDIVNVTDDNIELIIRTVIDNYDLEQYERYTENPNSYLFRGYSVGDEEVFKDREARKRFLDAIFIEERAKIKVCAYFKIGFNGSLNGNKNYEYPNAYNDYLVNPHFKIFLCFGNNEPLILSALRNGDYLGAINQLMSTAKNLNLAEMSQTVAPFLGWVFTSGNKRIIQMKDGRSLTIAEAYHELFDEKKEDEA